MDDDKLLKPAEVAEIIGLTEIGVLSMLRRGVMRGRKLGRGPRAQWRIRSADLQAFIQTPPDKPGTLTDAEIEAAVKILRDAFAAGQTFVTTEGLRDTVRCIDNPAPMFWIDLARGIQAQLAAAQAPNAR